MQLIVHSHLVSNVKDNNGGMGTSIVHRCQGIVPLLASCVPNLKLDRRVVQTNRLREECRSNGRLLNWPEER